MEIYKSETDEIIRRFLAGRLNRDQCIAGLYEAFSGALPCLGPEDLPRVREIMHANNEVIRNETERRRTRRKPEPSHCAN